MSEVTQKYQAVKAAYEKVNVDTDAVLKQLAEVKISMHVWQGDDAEGFLSDDELSAESSYRKLSRGRSHTGRITSRLEKAYSLIPGKHKLNLHAIYLDTDEKVDLNELEPKHFEKWVDWAKNQGLGLDFNPTFYLRLKTVLLWPHRIRGSPILDPTWQVFSKDRRIFWEGNRSGMCQ